ncbi:MAG: N-formylglutamate amidohydrolase [Desulfosporosinus sp.]|nr:N-formylglutamate amidohydrolase [Desulfosporosinus sp.]
MDKHEEVLKELNRARLNEEAVNAEKVHFYKTDRRVNPKQEEPFWLSVGESPILLSAPHAVRHYRQKKIKMSDQFTGSIVYILNKLTGCHAIATTKLYGGDPNVDDPCIYKDKISDFCNIKKVKFVIDIHGAARERLFDVDLGTNSGKNLLGKARVLEILEQNFKDFGLSRTSHDYSPASGPNTVASYVARELGIPAVQLEINKQYRVPAQNPQGFHRLLGALVKSIKELT